MAATVLVAAAALASGCSSAQTPADENAAPGVESGLATDISAAHVAKCRKIMEICPEVAPEAPDYVAKEIERLRLPYETFELRAGWPYGDPAKNRPPATAHVVVESGDVEAALGFAVQDLGDATSASDADLGAGRRDPANLGAVEWGGHSGTLVLAPSFARASTIHGDHVIFVSEDGFVISLHAWKPLDETIETLRQIVESAG